MVSIAPESGGKWSHVLRVITELVTSSHDIPYIIRQSSSGHRICMLSGDARMCVMLQLLLLRHAKTENDSSSGLDRDRQLDARGRVDAPEIGRYMLRESLIPEQVFVSPALRARETWDLVASTWPQFPEVDLVPDLYGADPAQLLCIVRDAAQARTTKAPHRVLVVGHNPGLHEFALGLIGEGEPAARQGLAGNLPTSGLAVIDFDGDDWSDISFQHGRLTRFISPSLMRAHPH
jgi:phosphohistidine phosphatase